MENPESMKVSVEKLSVKTIEEPVVTIARIDQEITNGVNSIKDTKDKVAMLRANLGQNPDVNVEIPSVQITEEYIGKLTNEKSRFNLKKPEGYGENKIKKTSLRDLPIDPESTFDNLNRTGERMFDETGKERVITNVNYNLSNDTELKIRGRDYTYQSKTTPTNRISAEYNKNDGKLQKMHFNSENPYFSGKAMLDMIERIPPGAEVLGGEVSMSTDSFPLLLNTLEKYFDKTPDRFSTSQEGELKLNDQGKFSLISRTENEDQKIDMINKLIDEFNTKTEKNITHARKDISENEENIMIPKLKIIKNY